MNNWKDLVGRPTIVATLVALLVRGVHLACLAGADPLFRFPVVDSWFHLHQAQQILSDGWLLPGHGAYYKGPLYSYWLAILTSLAGPVGAVIVGKLLNVVIGALSCGWVARIAEQLGGRGAAWMAGLLASCYGPAVYEDGVLLQTSIVTFLLLVAGERLLEAAKHFVNGELDQQLSLLATAGASLGLLTATRGEGLLVIAAAAFYVYRHVAQRTPPPPGWSGVRAAGLIVIPALLVVAPVTLRNALLEHDPVLVSWNGGINLFMGNDPAFEQASGQWHPDLAWMRLYDAPAQLGLARGADHQRFFLHQAWLAFFDDPLAAGRRVIEKAGLLLSGYEISNNQRIDEARTHSPLLAVLQWRTRWFGFPFGLIAPWLGMGLVLAKRQLAPARGLLWMAAAWAIVPILFFNTARYRVSAILLLMPLAATGWLAGDPQRRTKALAVGFLLLVIGLMTMPLHPTQPPMEALNLADVAEREGRGDEALALRRRALAEEPTNPFALIRLADTLRVSGGCEEALPLYRRVLADRSLASDWHHAAVRSTARCYSLLGRSDQAIEWFERFAAAQPDRPTTAGRDDFWLRGTPPLLACEIRLDLARELALVGKVAEAASNLAWVTAECSESESLAHKAQQRLRELAQRMPQDQSIDPPDRQPETRP